MQSSSRYGVIKNLIIKIVAQLEEAGRPDEAQAMLALTHVIGSRIEPPMAGAWTTRLSAWLTKGTCYFI